MALREKYSSNGDFTYSRTYHFDGLGSTMALSDENGIVTDTYKYDAWGNLITPPGPESTVDNPYQYVGQLGYYTHYQESDLDLLQLGVRYYDPEKGRFTQRDPSFSRYTLLNGNVFTHVNGRPTFQTDQMAKGGIGNMRSNTLAA